MIQIDHSLTAGRLRRSAERLFEVSAGKIRDIERTWDPRRGTPVFTIEGKYTSRGWTEWTQGFQFGSALLQFDATGEKEFLEIGRRKTLEVMATHVSHIGVHDHGFNNVSTYGNLLRLIREKRIPFDPWEKHFCELALKLSGAIQAARWSTIQNGKGYIYSFNGPHSLFSDTIRSLRALALGHQLGHVLMGEMDHRISLLERLVHHADTTARYNIYYGEGRDAYDVRGRVVHESIFNRNDGNYRCPSTQQGYSPFSTWTRGLAWIVCGYAEQLEFFDHVSEADCKPLGGKKAIVAMMLRAARATADFFIEHTPTDGIPYWDTGAPNLHKLGDYLERPADPFNDHEPVDSSAAAISAQGLLRLGRYLHGKGQTKVGTRYYQAGLTVARTLFDEPYLSIRKNHQGLILHSIYHRPNGWDHVPKGARQPRSESSMWGDYHARELAVMILREAHRRPYLVFFVPR